MGGLLSAGKEFCKGDFDGGQPVAIQRNDDGDLPFVIDAGYEKYTYSATDINAFDKPWNMHL